MDIVTDNKINYPYINSVQKVLSQPIETIDQYVEWVRNWKLLHAKLIEAINQARTDKDRARQNKDATGCNVAWYRKMRLRVIARWMYQVRNDRKDALHAGQYKQLELAA